MEKINYISMRVYKLLRNENFDKAGRPAILIKYLGRESLVWSGTTVKNINTKEKPWIIEFNEVKTYFYSLGIQKINTCDLKFYWTDKTNHIVYQLSKKQQEELVQKFSSFTKIKNPYLTIKDLEVKVLLQEEIINQQKIMIENLQKQIKEFEEQNNIRSNKYDFKR